MDVTRALIEKGANANVAGDDGATPLHYATDKGICLLSKLLL